MNTIQVRGASIHNLKSINVDIPKGSFVVVTGVSGSGKSSLAFDLLYDEGRRRYLQSIGLSTHSDWNEDGEPFDELRGLPPAVSVEQQTIRQTNPRSIVGTKTKMLEYLRWLYSLEGRHSEGQTARLSVETFSFNSPAGMCPSCYGRGYVTEMDADKMLPDHTRKLGQICNRLGEFAKKLFKFLHLLGTEYRFDWQNEPYQNIPEKAKHAFLYGDDAFEGLLPFAKRTMERTLRSRLVGEMRLCSSSPCSECNGYRVGVSARSITIRGLHIGQLSHMSISEMHSFLSELERKSAELSIEGKRALLMLQAGCKKMSEVGLSYLSLLRKLPTLSGGELQRLFLMHHLQSDFDSLLYIFDEPTAGLHETEKLSLLNHLKSLTLSGNTVIVVEHDTNIIQHADYIIEVGPGAGKEGGNIVFQGTLDQFLASPSSVLGPYISGKRSLPYKQAGFYRSVTANMPMLTLREANLNNLQSVTVSFPLGLMIALAGRSGSGKSTLVSGCLVPLLQYSFELESEEEEGEESSGEENQSLHELGQLEGWEQIKKCVVVSQSPIGRSRLSTPITYVGIWDKVREIFSSLPLSIERGYTAGHFSFNTDFGSCPVCRGEGTESMELGPLGQMTRECHSCRGSRYRSEILEAEYKGVNIHQLLTMSVNDAIPLFEGHKPIVHMLMTLERVGLGYLSLGQPAVSLSGGEAQRIKLAKELGRAQKSKSLYILDEPTTGLSMPDIEKLMLLLNELTEQGNTIIIIEHDVAVLSYCDWIIEMGPGGGADGGKVIAQGTPLELKGNSASSIGPYLLVV